MDTFGSEPFMFFIIYFRFSIEDIDGNIAARAFLIQTVLRYRY